MNVKMKKKKKYLEKNLLKLIKIIQNLIINEKKINLIDKYKLKKGKNNVKLKVKNEITNLSYMFYQCKILKNIDELKYLNTSNCNSFEMIFSGCSSLTNIKSLENWNVSNGNNFRDMFYGCSSLTDIKLLKIGMFQMVIILDICSVIVHLYQILNLYNIGNILKTCLIKINIIKKLN